MCIIHSQNMQKIILFLSGIIFIAATSCKQAKETSAASGNETMTKAEQKADSFPEKSRLVISFYSVASGVDYPYVLKFEDSIGEYAGELGINIDYEKTHWGREGETDFCMELTELTSEQQADFVNRTRKLLESAEHVKIYENEPCRHRRSR
jgi:hypothetical protein